MNFNYCPSCGTKASVEQLNSTAYQCTKCGWQFWNGAKATVAAAFVRDGEILVSKRGREPNKGMYDLPGGFIDFGETAAAAAVREVREEAGVTIGPNDIVLLAVYHNQYDASTFTIDIVYLVHSWQGELKASDDSAALVWKPLSFINDKLFCEKFYTGLDQLIATRLLAARAPEPGPD